MVGEHRKYSRPVQGKTFKKVTIGWDLKYNIPVFGAEKGFQPSRDVWIMGLQEKKEIIEALSEKTSIPDHLYSKIFEPVTIAHRIPAPHGEYALEIWGHGLRLLSAEVDPLSGEWILYPTGALASIISGIGASPAPIESRRKLKGSKIRIQACTGRKLCLIRAGKYVGFASSIDKGNLYKVRDLAPSGFRILSRSTIGDFIKYNKSYIERIASEAREFIRHHSINAGQVYVAVSGGVDSTAAALLAVEALGSSRVRLVYADTGMEFPESRETVERLASFLGVKLDIVRSRFDPVREISKRGLMTRDNRWCTRILKLEPLREYYRMNNAEIVIDGSRYYESWNRALNRRVGVNPAIPGVKRLLPILYWTRLEVQAFVWLRGAPVNPLYDRGLSRIGCIICPAMALRELKIAYRLYPGFYEVLANALEKPGVRGGLEFLLSGKWRKL